MTPYLLNLCDLLLTLHAIHHGGVELNPLMQCVPVMVAWKVVGVGVLCGVLEYCARPSQSLGDSSPTGRAEFARRGLNLCTAVYAALCVYHFYFIFGGAF